jgi:hypothetical protein
LESKQGIDLSLDHGIRFATDDCTVGYAVGVAKKDIDINGRKSNEIPMDELLLELQTRLQGMFPKIDVEAAYRGQSIRLACGLILGYHEAGVNAEHVGLYHVWGMMDSLQMAPGAYLAQFAFEQLGVSPDQSLLVRSAVDEMHARYSR